MKNYDDDSAPLTKGLRGPLFKPHTLVRSTDPDTSNDAVSRLNGYSENCRKVYAEIDRRPCTDEEGREATGIHSFRRRRADLKNAGMVEDSGKRRPTPCGRPSIVWRVVR